MRLRGTPRIAHVLPKPGLGAWELGKSDRHSLLLLSREDDRVDILPVRKRLVDVVEQLALLLDRCGVASAEAIRERPSPAEWLRLTATVPDAQHGRHLEQAKANASLALGRVVTLSVRGVGDLQRRQHATDREPHLLMPVGLGGDEDMVGRWVEAWVLETTGEPAEVV